MLPKNNVVTIILPGLQVPAWVHQLLTDLSKSMQVQLYLLTPANNGGIHARIAMGLMKFEHKLSSTLRNNHLKTISLEGLFPVTNELSGNHNINLSGTYVANSITLKAGNNILGINNLFALLWQHKGHCFTVSSHQANNQPLCVYQTSNNTDFISSRLNNLIGVINDVVYYTATQPTRQHASAITAPSRMLLFSCMAYLLAYPLMVARIKLAARSGHQKWHLALLNKQQEVRIVPNPPGAFMADPFLFTYEEQPYVIYEYLPAGSSNGVINMAPVNGLSIGNPVNVLTENHHLSYPCVFTHNQQVWMIPESKNDHHISCYKLDVAAHTCSQKQILIPDIDAVDSTLVFHNQHYWLFCTAKTGTLSNSGDALMIYHATTPEGPWQAHAMNPVKLSNKEARPAGHLFVENGHLIRPVQDGSYTYGGAIRMMRIKELTQQTFVETTERVMMPQHIHPKAKAIHTINQTGELTVVDLVIHQKFAHV